MGSSPHMRGTLSQSVTRWWRTGIIPAYAGNTCQECWSAVRRRDHPRICGEHPFYWGRNTAHPGSSPHMRGTPTIRPMRPSAPGIIPAYAGNTMPSTSCRKADRDHPRICGEHSVSVRRGVSVTGSSPHMRGTPQRPIPPTSALGIIPAYAGNTSAPNTTD